MAKRNISDDNCFSANGPLSLDLAAGIRRVRGVKNLGARIGNWLTTDQACRLPGAIDLATLRGKRFVSLAALLGCGLRRAELMAITVEDFERRDGHWLLPDMRGKGGHIRTVPVAGWVKAAVDRSTRATGIATGSVFRAVDKS
jgi:integrase